MSAVTTPPPVIAPEGTARCNDRFEAEGGVRCERPAGHAGGHRSQSRDRYWQAAPQPLPSATLRIGGNLIPLAAESEHWCTECGNKIPPVAYSNGFRCCAPAVTR